MSEYDLLRKTELRVGPIRLAQANLTGIAARVAATMGLDRAEVLVVDYRDEVLVLDVMAHDVDPYAFVGKQEQLLQALRELPGVTLASGAKVSSDGMLGWIAMDAAGSTEALRRSEELAATLLANIEKRVLVFSTGAEVAGGEVLDTNTPALAARLGAEGFRVTAGGTLKDDRLLIAAGLREAIDELGYGVVITTGGVGAEDKDHTVEAVRLLDAEAETPFLCRFEVGRGRHVKEGIRIAVGRYHDATIVSLPGPNDEVKASLEILAAGLRQRRSRQALADELANNLRGILREKMQQRHGAHGPGKA